MFAFLESLFTHFGYSAVFIVLIACGIGVPIPEDITLVTGGVIAGLGHANMHLMFGVGMAGVLIGDSIVFLAGKFFGHQILKFPPIARVMTPKRYVQVQDKFDRYGNWVLFFARFLPGLRSPIFISAGMSKKISYIRFLIFDGLASCVSVPVWVYLGAYGAKNIDKLMQIVHHFQVAIFILMAVIIIVIIFIWWRKKQRIQFIKESRSLIRKRKGYKEGK